MARVRIFLLSLTLLACGAPEDVVEEIVDVIDTDDLTGHYGVRSAVGVGDRLCMIEEDEDYGSVALVTSEAGQTGCAGLGTYLRADDRVTLTMAGEERCEIRAILDEATIVFPQVVGDGCSYYCAANAELAGARFEKVENGIDAARAVEDPVGDPLCQ